VWHITQKKAYLLFEKDYIDSLYAVLQLRSGERS
jgi:hypothetical protein